MSSPDPNALRLRPLRAADEAEAIRAHEELAAEDFAFLLDWDAGLPWAAHVRRADELRRGVALPEHRVPATFLVAEVGGRIVGRVSVRHELNAFLEREGGHIGYAVRPGDRRRGYATAMLAQALGVARAAGVERVLVVCDEANAASAAIITRAGGVLEDVRLDDAGRRVARYWLD